jgi:hypothetical protein
MTASPRPSPRLRVPRPRALALLTAAAAALAAPAAALGSPRPLPFTYPYQTLPEGSLEVEQYVDLVPVRVVRELPDGTTEGVVSVRSELQTELEYGLTDRLEVALYFAFSQGGSATAPFLQFRGLKQRAHYRFAELGEWPVDVGVYLELAEGHSELEFEEKLLLSRQLGALNVAANLWVEQEWYFQTRETKYVYNPTVGATYEVSPRISLGAEYWVRGRFDKQRATTDTGETSDSPRAAAHYAGPTLLLQAKQAWISVGAYARLDQLGSGVAVGDPFGKVWIRAVLGLDL